MTDTAVPWSGPLVTGSEIARLAGVTRAAVSNWRRRHADFPSPAGGGVSSPLFELGEVQDWLKVRRKGRDMSVDAQLWQILRGFYGGDMLAALADIAADLAEGQEERTKSPRSALALGRRLAAQSSVGDVVEGLAGRYADSVRRTGGSDRVTSPRIARAVGQLAGEVAEGTTVFDPACGIGTLLLSVGPVRGVRRCGQDVDDRSARFARLRANLTGRGRLDVVTGDSMRSDGWTDLSADLVICDPPNAGAAPGRAEVPPDSGWELGTPSRAEGELAWLQHAYAHTAPGGRLFMVMPASVAHRKAGRRIRGALVRGGILVQVVALPAGSAASHSLPVHIWHLRRPHAAHTVADVRMVDLTGNDPDTWAEPCPDQVADVSPDELLDDMVDFTPTRYVTGVRAGHQSEYEQLRRDLRERAAWLAEILPPLVAGGGSDAASRCGRRGHREALRAVHEAEEQMERLAELTRKAVTLAREGLANGSLKPGDQHPGPAS
ncbi:HsdM family class I SAM-dependent methyltransferase [Streptomyces sp. DT195]|uniref:HsdM family class I SAM-dependent methyltransferase n=1 Tax=Streptomyces sp. DT195 TaxID=3393419 RepID=UPI003CF6842E